MEKKKYRPFVYDVESYRNFFCCTFLPLKSDELVTFVIDDKQNQALELIDFVKDTYLIGYNNKSYDNLIINYITKYSKTTASQIFDFGDGIIKSQNKDDLKGFFTKYKDFLYNDNYKYIDLIRMLFSKKLRVGLKELECSLNFKNVEELPYPVGSTLDEAQKKRVIEYNINDCEAQRQVALHAEKDIKLRVWTNKHFNVDVFSLDGVNLGVKILESRLAARVGHRNFTKEKTIRTKVKVKDVIYPFIKFKTKAFQQVLSKYQNLILKKYYDKELEKDRWTKFEYKPVIKGYMFKFGLGGLHFKTLNKAWLSNDTHDVISVDVR